MCLKAEIMCLLKNNKIYKEAMKSYEEARSGYQY